MDPAPLVPPPASPADVPVRFTGSGSEYFRIWIVNLLLSLVTLGIYSAWAKVRRLKYFYGNTLVDGSPLDFHGTPIAILKGRLIAFGLLVAWVLLQNFAPPLIVVLVFVAGMATLPWLIVRALRFRLANTSYRGVRFGFAGRVGEAFMVMLVWPVLSVLTLYLLTPVAYQRTRRFLNGNLMYGQLRGAMHAGVGAFYRVFIVCALVYVGILALWVVPAVFSAVAQLAEEGATPSDPGAAAQIFLGVILPAYFGLLTAALLVAPFFVVRMRNLVWNHTTLGPHRLRSEARMWPFFRLWLVNYVLIVLTLGLYLPFAQIRSARYLLTTMTVLPQGSLDEVAAAQRQQLGATGDETAEMFDVDIAL